ncbi:MAG: molecular chaperone DnaJ [Alphaproteobacteria bacterium]|nr:molecular chaperone DnaJ [Alphaproteobacteria bacterium]
MTERDYYEILEVSKSASGEEIKKSFRQLAMQYHPDRNPNDKEAEAKFKEINEAYEVLKDDQKRAAYDRYGHQAFANGGGGNPFGGFDFNFSGGGFADIFSSVFEEFMGGGRARSARGAYEQRGEDVRYDVSITLAEAFAGVEKEISVDSTAVCEKCHGHGTNDGGKAPVCPHCNGSGKVRMQQGFFVMEQPCPQCHGSGYLVKDKCEACKGRGFVEHQKTLKVKIPAGIYDGARIRVVGGGLAGVRGGAAGDLYVFVSVETHQIYERMEHNLYAQIPVSICCAALGGSVKIPSLDGSKIELKVPAGSQSEDIIRIKGQGMSILRSTSRGDLFVKLKVETPVNLTARQKELLEEFRKESGEDCQPQEKSFLDKIKALFSD